MVKKNNISVPRLAMAIVRKARMISKLRKLKAPKILIDKCAVSLLKILDATDGVDNRELTTELIRAKKLVKLEEEVNNSIACKAIDEKIESLRDMVDEIRVRLIVEKGCKLIYEEALRECNLTLAETIENQAMPEYEELIVLTAEIKAEVQRQIFQIQSLAMAPIHPAS